MLLLEAPNTWTMVRTALEVRELFSRFVEDSLDIHIELINDGKYVVRGQGTIQFQHESGGSFHTQDVLYLLGLKKNLFCLSQSWRTKVMRSTYRREKCSFSEREPIQSNFIRTRLVIELEDTPD